ncbi:MAG: response regulator, partial [Solirubrobacteraceae bacterium]
MTASTNQINERKPLRCIVADDHAATRQGASEILTAQGDIEVVASASDGPEAVHLISHYLPDLAIIDVLMPGQGGLDVCHEVREAGLPTAVLIYTGFPDPEVVRACLEAGARGFVLKSAQAEELLRAVRTIAAGDTYVDHTATQGEAEAPADSHRSVLSKREREVLQLLADGRTNDQAADALGLSPATVRTYVENAMQAQGRQSDPRGRRGRPPRPNRLTDASNLERSNRALSEAAYLIAHHLAEPLRAVSGFAGSLERLYGGRLDDAADEHLAHIVAGTRRMHAMLAGLSAFVASERAPLE